MQKLKGFRETQAHDFHQFKLEVLRQFRRHVLWWIHKTLLDFLLFLIVLFMYEVEQ